MEPFQKKDLPPLRSILIALGPGMIWMALAQGSGELIWWPFIIAKYGLTFLFLLIPACLLQYPLTIEIGRYTLLTGEGIFQGFFRLHWVFGVSLWILMTLSFLWFGAFASAGGTALAALTQFPPDWSPRGQTLFWAYSSIGLFVVAIVFSRVIYILIERFMTGIALLTLVGLIWACATPQVIEAIPAFLIGLFGPPGPLPQPWEPEDATKLLTAVTFAGLGGFWTLFYSYWLRDKGVGMAAHIGRITGPITGKPESIPAVGYLPAEGEDSPARWRRWMRYLLLDSGIGVAGNLLTTLMTCLLAYALLFPQGLLPEGYELAVVQSRFFEVNWGTAGRVIFLLVAAAFLSDTWLATADAVSRIQADIVYTFFPKSRRFEVRQWYYLFLGVLTVITSLTMLLEAPGPLILISAVIGFVGTVIFSIALLILNHYLLPPIIPAWARPGRLSWFLMILVCLVYGTAAIVYLVLISRSY